MKKRVKLEIILGKRELEPYPDQYKYVMSLFNQGKIKPVKTSQLNGKKPALHTEWWLIEKKEDFSHFKDEILLNTERHISIDYYIRHLDEYAKDRPYVRRLSEYLQAHYDDISRTAVSENERCVEIWGYEKFISEGEGKKILRRCNFPLSGLNTYTTAEPFAYCPLSRSAPQTLLITENRDPFVGMKRFLLEGHPTILGQEIGTLIYGCGERVLSTFNAFAVNAESYMFDKYNCYLYTGDLDWVGIDIFERLAEKFKEVGVLRPFVPYYLAMLKKGQNAKSLPAMSEFQNKRNSGLFFSYFDTATVETMKSILESGRYISQEFLNIKDY